jgi:hypothetical protein
MSTNKHGSQSVGSKPRDHEKSRKLSLRHAHKDWRVWIVALVLIALVLVYVMSNNLSMRPGKPVRQPMPAMGAS